MDSFEYCRDLAAPAGSSLYYATLFYQPADKYKLLTVFALLAELNKTVLNCQDPGVARMKLQWWMEELERLYAAQARHPVTKSMQSFVTAGYPEKHRLQQLVRFAENDINPAAVASLASMAETKSQHYGHGWCLADSLISSDSKQESELLNKLAGLYASVENMQSAYEKLHRGYCVFPEERMLEHGLNADDLLNNPSTNQTTNFLQDIFTSLQSELNTTLRTISEKEAQLPAFAICLALIASAKCTVLRKQSDLRALRNANITPLRKLWLCWKAKRISI